MKTILCFTLTLLIFLSLTVVPNSFAQATEPHNMVRLIYFVPRGRTPQRDMNAKLDKLIKGVQTLFADEMERHGFGRKAFVFETDSDGNAVVHRVNGNFIDSHYRQRTDGKVEEEVFQRFDLANNIYFIVVDVSTEQISTYCGLGGYNWNSHGDLGGRAFIPASGPCFVGNIGFLVAAHELGHAFGLEHNFSNDDYLMSYGSGSNELAQCSAEWFNAIHYFNSRQTPPNSGETRIEMLPPAASPPYGVRFQFKVSDPDGLQIAHLNTLATDVWEAPGYHKLLGCENLTGESQTVEFVTTELTTRSKSMRLHITDGVGNLAAREFEINISDLFRSPKVVSIPDANLAAAIRGALKLKTKRITQLDMLGLRGLRASNPQITDLNRHQQITDLTGLEHARNLKYLYLARNQISDITVLTKLPNLTSVSLRSNKIGDFTAVTELTNLIALDISDNPIKDLTLFAELINLRDLSLDRNQMSDLIPLAELTQLKRLYLAYNQINDLTPLIGLTNLTSLGLPGNQINDLSPLAGLTQLQDLYLQGNHINDVRPLTGLVALRSLGLDRNPILNGSALRTLLQKNPDLKLDIDIPQDTPVVQAMLAKSPPMYWIDTKNGTLHRAVSDRVENLVPSVQNATSLAVDMANEKLYWTEKTSNTTGKIRRANLDGTNVQLVKELTGVPLDIALDTVSSKLYLTNSWGKVQRLNFDGSNFEPNLITGLESPTDFALDVAGGKVYWTENAGSIRRANLDSSGVETFMDNLGTPKGIAVTSNKIYWTEQTNENTGKIQRADLSGENVETVATVPGTPHGISIDIANRKLYWTNAIGGIQRANLNGGNGENLVTELTAPGDFALSPRVVRILVAASQRPPMYWVDANAGTLHRLTGSTIANIAPNIQNTTSLAVDPVNGKLYWTEKTSDTTGKVRRANLDGTNVQLVKALTSVAHGIAIDTANRKLYWTNSWGKVQRLNVDGSNFQPNLITGLELPKHLVLDVAGGKIYWTEKTSDTTGKIQRANLDGANVQLVKALTSVAHGIAIDTTNHKLYWTNFWGKVQRLNVDGSNFQPNLITDLDAPEGIAVDTTGGKLYWTDAGGISRANLNGENIQNVVTGLGAPADIVLGSVSDGTAIAAAPAIVAVAPDETLLHPNYPNPFNPETWIPYQLAKDADVTLHIYAVNGQVVRTLTLGYQPAGIYRNRSRSAYWDGKNEFGEPVASGVYFYTLTAGDFTATRKMLIRK